jgi:hypothetical protein
MPSEQCVIGCNAILRRAGAALDCEILAGVAREVIEVRRVVTAETHTGRATMAIGQTVRVRLTGCCQPNTQRTGAAEVGQ